MSLIAQAWEGLTPEPFQYQAILLYSGRFKAYNGNISLRGKVLTVNLSKEWKHVSSDIQLGIIQHLLTRLFKRLKQETLYIELYHNFLKHADKIVSSEPLGESVSDGLTSSSSSSSFSSTDPVLYASFVRVNDRFFSGRLDVPRLKWSTGKNRLGSYHYGSDTVTLTRLLERDFDLLDYVMYHELLHKVHKFTVKNGRSFYHTSAFRRDEAKFPDASVLERRLRRLGLPVC